MRITRDQLIQLSISFKDMKIINKQCKCLKFTVKELMLTSSKPGYLLLAIYMIKLNTDGDCNANNYAGYGGVLWDHHGNWKGGFSKYVGNCSTLMAEFWGVLEGIKLSKKLGFKHLEINMDTLMVVQAIEDGKVGSIECVAILLEI